MDGFIVDLITCHQQLRKSFVLLQPWKDYLTPLITNLVPSNLNIALKI